MSDPVRGRPARRDLLLWAAVLLVVLVMTFVYTFTRGPQGGEAPFVAGSGSPVPSVNPHLIGKGWLHAEGTSIATARGRKVRFTGVGLQTLQGLGIKGHAYDVPDEQDFENIVGFGFNTVRLPIRWLFIEPDAPTKNADGTVTHHFDQTYLQDLDAVIHGLGNQGIKVIISMNAVPGIGGEVERNEPVKQVWAMPTWLYPQDIPTVGDARCAFFANQTEPGVPLPSIQDGLVDVWRMVAGRYADDSTVVGADILNEPYLPQRGECGDTASDLANTLTKLGSAISDANRRLLLVFEDASSSPQGPSFLASPPPLPNLVYSFHLYVDELSDGLSKYRFFLERARGWNVPLYVGEFDAFSATQRGTPAPGWQGKTEQFLQRLKRDDVGWTVWAYCCAGNSLFLPQDRQLKPDILPVIQSGIG